MSLDGLEGLTTLTALSVYECELVDISTVATMSSLDYLYLSFNNITDISALGANTGLGEGDELHMHENDYSCYDPVIALGCILLAGAAKSMGVRDSSG